MAYTHGYYDQMLAQGMAYEGYVRMQIEQQLYIKLDIVQGLEQQEDIGETRQGVEIKYDKKYAHTQNLYIELAEKCRPWKAEWTPAGIYRDDNTWLIAIGDYTVIFLFSKRQLQQHVQMHWDQIIRTETSIGILLDPSTIERLAVHIIKSETSNG